VNLDAGHITEIGEVPELDAPTQLSDPGAPADKARFRVSGD
jgi:hypothetical protein